MENPGVQVSGGAGTSMPPLPFTRSEGNGGSSAAAYLARVQRLRARRQPVWGGFPIGAPRPFGNVVPYSLDGGK